jgi:alkanesulfonate monooxygenase SsuD/methylene tetrahydromethanopterin reductase-like flavin-dependent oxidoreductase (luciferase family)
LGRAGRTAERGKLDVAFFADFVGQSGDSTKGIERRHAFLDFEPLTLSAALASITSRIGLVATVNTNFEQPYALARRFASLDHISGGRIGWNIVSSLADGARAASGSISRQPCRALCSAPPSSSMSPAHCGTAGKTTRSRGPTRRAASISIPTTSIRSGIDGRYFHLSIPCSTSPRPIQGHPVFAQAGNSEVGREFAAKYAEMIYAAAQFIEDAQSF